MAADSIQVRLGLSRVRVVGVLRETLDELEVEVESTARRGRCPGCGVLCRRVHDRRLCKVRDLDAFGKSVTLKWRRRRFVCDECGELHFEPRPGAFSRGMTTRLERRIVQEAKAMTISKVADRWGISWYKCNKLVRVWAGLLMQHRRRRRCKVLLVDETSMRKGHRYVTVVVSGDTGRTLAVLEHRDSAALSRFLLSQGHRWLRGVKVVVTDGSSAYRSAVRQHLPHARHVLDRFHVIRWFQAGLTALRCDVQRKKGKKGKQVFDRDVFNARFALLTRDDHLDDTDRERLQALFKQYSRLQTGWQALHELHGLYLADDRQGALAALKRFRELYDNEDLPEFSKIVDSLTEWSDEILDWHDTNRPSNGRIEGINNLIQILRRTAHGFTNRKNLQARIIHLI